MDPGVRFSELLAYNEDETGSWRRFFREHPAALDVPTDIANTGSVRQLVLHVFVTELYFANLLAGAPNAGLDKLPCSTVEELFAVHAEAHRKFEDFLEKAAPAQWEEVVALGFRDLKASRRKMFTQAMLHGVNHRAQLATLLRQQGFQQDWIHDIILSPAMR